MVTPFFPLPMIVDSGGMVGALAFVTVKPTVAVGSLLPLLLFLRMILMCVGLVILRKN